jgi:hypothetical protein
MAQYSYTNRAAGYKNQRKECCKTPVGEAGRLPDRGAATKLSSIVRDGRVFDR